MSLVAGSYERFIWGFKLKSSNETLSLSPLFSYPSHLSQIKAVAISGAVVASGGTDDTIHIYNLNASSSLGSLHDHTATITALSFYTPPHLNFPRNLISAAADGAVCIYDADSFVHLKTVSAHRKSVNDLALHPSGKLALTVGRDECLAMLNLVRGRRSFYCRLGREASLVKFDLTGDKFIMAMEEKASVHVAEDARLLLEFQHPKRILCIEPAENGLLYTGGEDRNITAWDPNSGKVAYCIEDAHKTRIKGIVVLSKDGSDGNDDPHLVATASSDGVIRVWDDRMATREKLNPLAEVNTKSRLTCLAGTSIKHVK
ncbi:hypothetical protein QN277_018627 [Acacia crassicarpa]|uniref:P21-activated protein kinase-interacting protein 1-like n=1 Tax=Acacia crassicarpa TaxID=499986 RepID=A0AAE1KHY1_9FABA|nr:hypothetical protein QN277_018627 [Acacia crassicarpa]